MAEAVPTGTAVAAPPIGVWTAPPDGVPTVAAGVGVVEPEVVGPAAGLVDRATGRATVVVIAGGAGVVVVTGAFVVTVGAVVVAVTGALVAVVTGALVVVVTVGAAVVEVTGPVVVAVGVGGVAEVEVPGVFVEVTHRIGITKVAPVWT